MALKQSYIPLESTEPYANSAVTANSQAVSAGNYGFSLEAYREANKVKLFLSNKVNGTTKIFEAYYVGGFSFAAEIQTASYAADLMKTLNGMGPLWRSTIESLAPTLGLGAMSGAFAAPLKPYILGSEPLTFELKCHLPLITDTVTETPYVTNIKTPINTLLKVLLPTENESTAAAREWVDNLFTKVDNFTFKDDDGIFWKGLQAVLKGYKRDFFDGIYQLNTPIQFAGDNKIILKIGPWRVPNVFLNKAVVDYSPLFYSDGTNVYPAHANVTLYCTTLRQATVQSLDITQDYNKDIDKYLPKDDNSNDNR